MIVDEIVLADTGRISAALDAAASGTIAVQLRAKSLPGLALFRAASSLRRVCTDRGAPLLINDRADIALAAEADGVHLPTRGLPPRLVRERFAPLLVGASTHDLDEARAAEAAGAHFVTFGPVWPTPSKHGFLEPRGPEHLAETARALAIPVFALGGVSLDRLPACRAARARAACIRAVLHAPDPAAAAAEAIRRLGLASPLPPVAALD